MFHSPLPDRQGAHQRTDEEGGGNDADAAPVGATAITASAEAAVAANATVTKGPAIEPEENAQNNLLLPNCNSDEKAWLQQYQDDQRRLTMESIALDRSKELDRDSAAALLKEIYRVKETAAKMWAFYQNKMRARGRSSARLQMKPKWQEIDLLMEQAIYRLSTRYPELVDNGGDDDDAALPQFIPTPGAHTGARAKQVPVVTITAPPTTRRLFLYLKRRRKRRHLRRPLRQSHRRDRGPPRQPPLRQLPLRPPLRLRLRLSPARPPCWLPRRRWQRMWEPPSRPQPS